MWYRNQAQNYLICAVIDNKGLHYLPTSIMPRMYLCLFSVLNCYIHLLLLMIQKCNAHICILCIYFKS